MIGTLINSIAILVGSFIGTLAKKGLKENYQNMLYISMGLAATGLGIETFSKNMSTSEYPVLFILSLAIGGIIGTRLNLTEQFNRIIGIYSTSNLGEGLTTAVILFCFGTLSILGPIESALNNDHTYLFTNATLDFVTSIVLASTYGVGIAFSGIVLFFWQGTIFLLATQIAPFITQSLMTEISIVGGFLIFSSGLTILKIKEIKTLDLLPAIFIPVIYFSILHIF
ncbi:MAG: DUF554 domain-containing protein [Enterococcus sp.]